MAQAKIDPSHIVTGPWKDVLKIPDTDIYSFMFLRENVGNYPPAVNPAHVAFIDAPSGRKITFGALKERVDLLSRGLSKGMNINRDDTVCFYIPNHVPELNSSLIYQMDYPTSLWAALRLGAIPSCANPIYTANELFHQLKLSKSKFILTHPLFLKSALEAASQVGIPNNKIFLLEKGNNLPFANVPDLVKLGETAPEIIPLKLRPHEAKTKVALLNFSSGTSGLPKGVLITHFNIIANICQLYEVDKVTKEDPSCNGCLPFFHSISLYN
jgi:4-coumarate--CoA ligase